ncbi:MAG TPA: glycosyltransferase family 2 protein [Chthoniobacterales bacterium]|nr:glycosyltransferase family 2 protein [Chthoniobacterales bacterium]
MAISRQQIGAVVIGRNEGGRLAPSLASVRAAGLPLVYADSGSADGSAQVAEALGIPTVELDPSRPFSAGRGRNEGLGEAMRRWPSIKYVLFLDGDCTLDAHFPAAAVAAFEQHAECAIVTGHLSERHPDASVYNRLCAIEWRSPAGRIENMGHLGGIMVARIDAFRQVGGFDEQVIAGEEPDLGVRLGLAGYTIVKLDRPMATHDAQMSRFSQWWKRSVRGGHALAHRYARNGGTSFRDGRRELRSVLFWGFFLPASALLLVWPTRGLSLILFGGYVLLGARVYRHYLSAGLSSSDAWLVTRFILYGKFAEMLGVIRYGLNRMRGSFRIIEYK